MDKSSSGKINASTLQNFNTVRIRGAFFSAEFFRILLSSICVLSLLIVFPLSVSLTEHLGSVARANPGDTTAENTDNCPFSVKPPPAVDRSEVPKSGVDAPDPLPVQNPPIGGDQLRACGIVAPRGAPPLPRDITSTAWLVADLDSGKVLAAKDPHGRYRPASTIKLLLAYTVMQHLPLTQLVHGLASDEQVEGDHLGLIAQGNYSVETLLEGLLLISGNDAAVALSRALGGEKRTLELMNANARKLWALDTRAASVSGLDAPGMSTSPYDEALILRAVLKNPDLRRILQMHSAFFHSNKDATGHTIMAQNSYVAYDRGGIGGKTGYTDDAEKTYVGAVRRNGRNLIVVQMYGFSVGVDSYWHQSDELLDWGSHIPRNLSVGQLVTPSTETYPLWKPIPLQPAMPLVVPGTNNYQWFSWIVLVTCALALILVAYVWKNMRENHARQASAHAKNLLRARRLTSLSPEDNLLKKPHYVKNFYPEKAARTEQEMYFRHKNSSRERTQVANPRRLERQEQRSPAVYTNRSRMNPPSGKMPRVQRNPAAMPERTESLRTSRAVNDRNRYRTKDSPMEKDLHYSAYGYERESEQIFPAPRRNPRYSQASYETSVENMSPNMQNSRYSTSRFDPKTPKPRPKR